MMMEREAWARSVELRAGQFHVLEIKLISV